VFTFQAFEALYFVNKEEDPVLLQRMFTLSLETSATVDDFIFGDATDEEACGICQDVYDKRCDSPSRCRNCGRQTHFGKECLMGRVFSKGTCPGCKAEVG